MVRERMKKAVLLCVSFLAAVSVALAAFIAQRPASAISEKDVKNDFGILVGQSKKLVLTSGSTGKVKWSSSNEKVISCDKDGTIKGISNGSAVITAKQGKETYRHTYYCAKQLDNSVSASPKHFLAFICNSPLMFRVKDVHIYIPFFTKIMSYKIIGTYDNWFYVSYERYGQTVYGFMLQYDFSDSIASDEVFKQISRNCLDVFCGEKRDIYRLTTDYKGNVKWSVADTSIVQYNESTEEVYGKKPGVTTISATANGKTLTCVVRVIYHWKQSWQTNLISDGDFYMNSANGLKKTATIPKGISFFICGDMGTQDKNGWAYGSTVIDSKELWGYIKINAVSQKGTVSQYRGLNWLWPIKGEEFKYVSSPYGPRKTKPRYHKGIDITGSDISGTEVISPFKGRVLAVCMDKSASCGYCVVLQSDEVDPITGNKYVAAFMHLKNEPSFEELDNISKGGILGEVGSTGNSGAAHLHFEVNNKNIATVTTQGKYNSALNYDNLINPIFFYMDKGIAINSECEAMKYKRPYWYGKETEKN